MNNKHEVSTSLLLTSSPGGGPVKKRARILVSDDNEVDCVATTQKIGNDVATAAASASFSAPSEMIETELATVSQRIDETTQLFHETMANQKRDLLALEEKTVNEIFIREQQLAELKHQLNGIRTTMDKLALVTSWQSSIDQAAEPTKKVNTENDGKHDNGWKINNNNNKEGKNNKTMEAQHQGNNEDSDANITVEVSFESDNSTAETLEIETDTETDGTNTTPVGAIEMETEEHHDESSLAHDKPVFSFPEPVLQTLETLKKDLKNPIVFYKVEAIVKSWIVQQYYTNNDEKIVLDPILFEVDSSTENHGVLVAKAFGKILYDLKIFTDTDEIVCRHPDNIIEEYIDDIQERVLFINHFKDRSDQKAFRCAYTKCRWNRKETLIICQEYSKKIQFIKEHDQKFKDLFGKWKTLNFVQESSSFAGNFEEIASRNGFVVSDIVLNFVGALYRSGSVSHAKALWNFAYFNWAQRAFDNGNISPSGRNKNNKSFIRQELLLSDLALAAFNASYLFCPINKKEFGNNNND